MHLGKFSFANPSQRRRASHRVALLTPPQQFESRCLLAAANGLPALATTDGLAVAQSDPVFDSSHDDDFQAAAFGLNEGLDSSLADFHLLFDLAAFSDTDLFAEFDSLSSFGSSEGDLLFEGDFVELAGADLPESFVLEPESIRNAVDALSNERGVARPASGFNGLDSDDLRIISLRVTASSGVTLPVDLFVWDSGADSALSADFLAQVEEVLNDTLKDVLATGGMTSITDSGLLPSGSAAIGLTSASAATSYADTYGIQPLEIYVDVSQDEFSPDGGVYISGVTVVSEDPLDPEFLILDEYFFVAEDFSDRLSGFEGASAEAQSLRSGDAIGNRSDGDAAGTSSAASDATETDDAERAGLDSSERSPSAEASEADEAVNGLRSTESKLANRGPGHDTDSLGPGAQEQIRGRDVDFDAEARRSKNAQKFARRTAGSENGADSNTVSGRQRFRIRVAQVARQIAEAASDSSTQLRAQGLLPASTGAYAVTWAGRLAAFAQPVLNEQLLGLSGPEGELNGDDSGQPTCAQIASATGVLLIAASATAQTVRQRHQHRNHLQTGRRSHVSLQDTNRIADENTLA